MGGNAFSEFSYYVPRMSYETYACLTEEFLAHLRPLFKQVAAPPECPGKADHGDVDILVCEPTFAEDRYLVSLAGATDAVKMVGATVEGATLSLAIADEEEVVLNENHEVVKRTTYRQLDVHRCRVGTFEWECFTKSYGDLWSIISTCMRWAGLSASDQGLFLMISEIESIDRKAARVFLTRSPVKALAFLGLRYEEFQRGWETVEAMFYWIVGMRLFGTWRAWVAEANVQSLKPKDRKRLELRPVYRQFITEFVPSLPPGHDVAGLESRAQVLLEALERFNAREVYDKIVTRWRLQQQRKSVWQNLPTGFPESTVAEQRRMMKTLKQYITLDPDVEPEISSGNVPTFVKSDGTIDEEGLRTWVSQHWLFLTEEDKENKDRSAKS